MCVCVCVEKLYRPAHPSARLGPIVGIVSTKRIGRILFPLGFSEAAKKRDSVCSF